MKKDISNAEGAIRNLTKDFEKAMKDIARYNAELEQTTDQKRFLEISNKIDEATERLAKLDADKHM